jgi:predicted RNA-binding Zn ribbon-like protein
MADASRWPKSVAGHVALDFANTDVYAQGDEALDVLHTAAEFAAWCGAQGLALAPDNVRQVHDKAERATLAGAAALRSAVRAVAEDFANGRTVTQEALDSLHSSYADALGRSRATVTATGLEWSWNDGTPQALIDALAHSAVTLMAHGRVDRIKACPACGFLFLDKTKNGSRRWCDMADCGTEDKSRRYVEKRAERRAAGRER